MAAYVNAVNMERRPRGLPGAPLLVAGGLAYGDSGKARSATMSADQWRSASCTPAICAAGQFDRSARQTSPGAAVVSRSGPKRQIWSGELPVVRRMV